MDRFSLFVVTFVLSIFIFLSLPLEWQNFILRKMQSTGSGFNNSANELIQRNEDRRIFQE